MKKLISILLITLLSGCASYEFGDITRAANKIFTLKQDYCKAENAEQREFYLFMIRKADPDWDAVCGDD